MKRTDIINIIGRQYLTSNIETDEFSYIKKAGSKLYLEKKLGKTVKHYKLDIRFQYEDVVVIVETKQRFTGKDEVQLMEYLAAEVQICGSRKIVSILANTINDGIKVWKYNQGTYQILEDETTIQPIEHYLKMFLPKKQNDREKVLRNTYDLNELLHSMDIDENTRSQFVGTCLLYLKDKVRKEGVNSIDKELIIKLNDFWKQLYSEQSIITEIESTLGALLDGSNNKEKKIQLLQKNVLSDQKIKKLNKDNWITILDKILIDIYKFIDTESIEGQDILNLFFIAFNKYTGKADKNQAFTPDHITHFMTELTEVDRNSIVLDATCGSGSFLVQAMVKSFNDCKRGKTDKESEILMKNVADKHIFGIEIEEKAYGLATTNMLIHGDGNSNIEFGSCFDHEDFIKKADPSIILMNPPYNAKPKGVPEKYKQLWSKQKGSNEEVYWKEDPTKGFVFIHYLSDVIKKMNKERENKGECIKLVKLAVLLPVAAAIGRSADLKEEKRCMLEDNTLEAVFSLPSEIFYPGASANACCMLFTLGKPHPKNYRTFFGYYKDDGFKKRKNLGRVEQFDDTNNSKWKAIEEEWLSLFRNKTAKDGMSACRTVSYKDEWLCEAYMSIDFRKLTKGHFRDSINKYLSFLVLEGKFQDVISDYLDYSKKQKKDETCNMLNFEKWRNFKLSKILLIINGSGITKEEIEENPGHLKAVQSGEDNNGVLGKIDINYCKSKKYRYTEEPCLTVARSGSSGFVSFQPNGCVVGDSAKMLLLDQDLQSTNVFLFLQTILTSLRVKYAYGRKVTESNYSNEKISLPVLHDSSGNPVIDKSKRFSDKGYIPDWEYMNQYIKSIIYEKK